MRLLGKCVIESKGADAYHLLTCASHSKINPHDEVDGWSGTHAVHQFNRQSDSEVKMIVIALSRDDSCPVKVV